MFELFATVGSEFQDVMEGQQTKLNWLSHWAKARPPIVHQLKISNNKTPLLPFSDWSLFFTGQWQQPDVRKSASGSTQVYENYRSYDKTRNQDYPTVLARFSCITSRATETSMVDSR